MYVMPNGLMFIFIRLLCLLVSLRLILKDQVPLVVFGEK